MGIPSDKAKITHADTQMAAAIRQLGGSVPEKTTSFLGDIDDNWLMKYDTDKDGQISEKELRAAIGKKGGWWPWLFSRWYAARCMAAADKNRDGYIRGDELNSLLEFARKKLVN